MQKALKLDKKSGETPLECINRFKVENPEYEGEKMTYAGRLDPLASGVLLILVGEECKNKDKYLGLDKEYEVDILLGVGTDTYDVLGKVTDVINNIVVEDVGVLEKTLKGFVGKFSQKYPLYSSKTVLDKEDGIMKPLFDYAKSGRLDDLEIPQKEVEIFDISLLGVKKINAVDLKTKIFEDISLVKGDFRQEEIISVWESFFDKNVQSDFRLVSVKVSCSSGTYMRSLAKAVGDKLGISALALNIVRTKIGQFSLL